MAADAPASPGARGRFPGFDVLDQAAHWDAQTRAVVLGRVGPLEPLAFFTAAEEPTFRALCDRLLAQDGEPRVPVAELVDQRLARREGDGYRYGDMPEDGDAWRRSLAGLDDAARREHGRAFAELGRSDQRALIEGVRVLDGDWHGMPASRLFGLWMRYTTTAFYSHPLAWNEIGFPGPAYPRGYKHLAVGGREPFETPEVDAHDPIPWAHRVDAAKRAHADRDVG
jgi:hypothetical protein